MVVLPNLKVKVFRNKNKGDVRIQATEKTEPSSSMRNNTTKKDSQRKTLNSNGKKEKNGSLSPSENSLLEQLYSQGPAAYGSINNLKKFSGLTYDQVRSFLTTKKAYTKYKSATRKFRRLPVKARFINDIWCMDLAQMDKLAEWNSGVKFLMISVDVFSRFIRVEPMKNKKADTTKAAFIKMCSRQKIDDDDDEDHHLTFPKKLWVDRGKEFKGDFHSFCSDVGTKVYHTFSDTKAAFAERAIRSLKNIIYRFLENNQTDKYLPSLQKLVQTMNARENRSIGMKPKDVTNQDFLKIMHKENYKEPLQPKLKVGDCVRISIKDKQFRKGYKPQFTEEVFTIVKIVSKRPTVTYNIKDGNGEIILGKFYEQELSKTII